MGAIRQIIDRIQSKEISCVELMSETLANIRQTNDDTNAFIETFDDAALVLPRNMMNQSPMEQHQSMLDSFWNKR